MRKRKLFSLFILLFFTCSILLIVNLLNNINYGEDNSEIPLEITTVIYINDNGDFTSYASSGNGNPSTPWIIENYVIGADNSIAIYITGTTDHFVIRNSKVEGRTAGQPAIYMSYVSNANISGNTFLNNGVGLNFLSVSNSFIQHNVINYHTGSGIDAYNCNNLTIYNNSILYNAGNGIDLCGSDNNVSFNQVTNNGNNGLYTCYFSDNNVTNNNFSENALRGIYWFSNTNDNNFSENTINNNAYGIEVRASSTGNLVSYNTLHYNSKGTIVGSMVGNTLIGNDIKNDWDNPDTTLQDILNILGIIALIGVIIILPASIFLYHYFKK